MLSLLGPEFIDLSSSLDMQNRLQVSDYYFSALSA
jgi:hypothetical protein